MKISRQKTLPAPWFEPATFWLAFIWLLLTNPTSFWFNPFLFLDFWNERSPDAEWADNQERQGGPRTGDFRDKFGTIDKNRSGPDPSELAELGLDLGLFVHPEEGRLHSTHQRLWKSRRIWFRVHVHTPSNVSKQESSNRYHGCDEQS